MVCSTVSLGLARTIYPEHRSTRELHAAVREERASSSSLPTRVELARLGTCYLVMDSGKATVGTL